MLPLVTVWDAQMELRQYRVGEISRPATTKKENQMATAKKMASNAKALPKKVTAANGVTPVAKAPAKKAAVLKAAKAIAKISGSIAKLTERKNKISAEIQALRDQRTALKAPATAGSATSAAATAAPKVSAKVTKKAAVKTVKLKGKK